WSDLSVSLSDFSIGVAPLAQGDPVTSVRDVSSVVYRGFDSHIHELSLSGGASGWGLNDLSTAVMKQNWLPGAASDPASYGSTGDGAGSVVYRGFDGLIYQLVHQPFSKSVILLS